MKYERAPISDFCEIRRKAVSPKNGTEYWVYSLPAFDNGAIPERMDGANIKSGKLEVFADAILFNKLNVQFKRVWNVGGNVLTNSVCSTEFIPLEVKEGYCRDYLYYNLISYELTEAMYKARKGTSNSQQRIDPQALLGYRIPCPCIEMQKKIASVLSALDDKIELNNRINKNLEA